MLTVISIPLSSAPIISVDDEMSQDNKMHGSYDWMVDFFRLDVSQTKTTVEELMSGIDDGDNAESQAEDGKITKDQQQHKKTYEMIYVPSEVSQDRQWLII